MKVAPRRAKQRPYDAAFVPMQGTALTDLPGTERITHGEHQNLICVSMQLEVHTLSASDMVHLRVLRSREVLHPLSMRLPVPFASSCPMLALQALSLSSHTADGNIASLRIRCSFQGSAYKGRRRSNYHCGYNCQWQGGRHSILTQCHYRVGHHGLFQVDST